MPPRILTGDRDRELEGFGETQSAEFLCGRFGNEQVAALECSAKDGPGMPLYGA